MRLNDRPTDGQPHASPVILGRKECPENLVGQLRGQSDTRIADRDQQLTIAADLMASSLPPLVSFMASMPLSMRFMKTCCSCTRFDRSKLLCNRLSGNLVRSG
jgi:hypothetical protein